MVNKKNESIVYRSLDMFLEDEDGKVSSVMLNCLKPKVGSGTIMEESPDHLPDESEFQIEDIIDGPIKTVPLRNKKWDIPEYDSILTHFKDVLEIDRLALKNSSL